ncbi:hypothetical protein B0H15DRAFT_859995 [Mycena belliarum]|uniref:Uncharacterized protein n=1 Tax=Mycena belliarum TaxID=1033014 RepID=A0AAD6TXG8_9AGAR|nr:hypothetical protein B0H15DRAFT_859995 [Mycena belliae]
MTRSDGFVLAIRRACLPPQSTPRFTTRGYRLGDKKPHKKKTPKRSGSQFRYRNHVLSTLDPSRLSFEDHLDLSGRTVHRANFAAERASSNAALEESSRLVPGTKTRVRKPEAIITYVQYYGNARVHLPFPSSTQGFLYYHPGSPTSPLGGSLRFRITPDPSPKSFHLGSDLLFPSGSPWRILLPQIACRIMFAKLGPQLVRDRLVTDDLLSRCRDLFQNRGRIHPDTTVFGFDSTFLVEFNKVGISQTVVGSRLHKMQLEMFKTSTKSYPWIGSALARFEPSTLPQYAGRRVLHLRFVKIIEFALRTLDDDQQSEERFEHPEEGKLLTRCKRKYAPARPWAYDIDKSDSITPVALRDLWEKSRTA